MVEVVSEDGLRVCMESDGNGDVFFHDAATAEIYTYWHTLALRDALPIGEDGFARCSDDARCGRFGCIGHIDDHPGFVHRANHLCAGVAKTAKIGRAPV